MATRTFQERLSSASAAITHGTIALVRAMVPIVLFFFVAFFLIFLIFRAFCRAIFSRVLRIQQSRDRRTDHGPDSFGA